MKNLILANASIILICLLLSNNISGQIPTNICDDDGVNFDVQVTTTNFTNLLLMSDNVVAARGEIETAGSITIDNSSGDAEFVAGQKIKLTQGFSAKNTQKFRAYLGTCASGCGNSNSGGDITVNTLTGNGNSGYVDGDPNTAEFRFVIRLDNGLNGNLYVIDGNNVGSGSADALRRVDNAGNVITIINSTNDVLLTGLKNIEVDLNNIVNGFPTIYIARVKLISGEYKVSVLNITHKNTSFTGADEWMNWEVDDIPVDITISDGRSRWYVDLSMDDSDNLFLSDVSRVFKLDLINKTNILIAGDDQVFVDNENGTKARFLGIFGGIDVNSAGDAIYVSDNRRIRRIIYNSNTGSGLESDNWDVTTIAGSGSMGFVDASGTKSEFENNGGIEVNCSGDVYVASNQRIRKIINNGGSSTTESDNWDVITIAGNGNTGYVDGSAINAEFSFSNGTEAKQPIGNISLDESADVIKVADAGNERIRSVVLYGTPSLDISLAPKVFNPRTGSTVGYAVKVCNLSQFKNADNVVVESILPSSLSFVRSTEFTNSGNTLTSNAFTVAPNSCQYVRYVAKITSLNCEDITNCVKFINADGGFELGAEACNVITSGGVFKNLGITQNISSASVSDGSTVTYQITVTNQSSTIQVDDIVIGNDLPSGLTFVSSSGTVVFTESNGVLTSGTFNLAASSSQVLSFDAVAGDCPSITNCSYVVLGGGCDFTMESCATLAVTGTSFGPIAATCTPTRTGDDFEFRITNVSLESLENSTPDATEDYHDFTCIGSVEVYEGSSYPISITTSGPASHNVRVWIDYNNDGDFVDANELIFSADNVVVASGNIIIPSGTTLNTQLRMRVASDWNGTAAPAPCGNFLYGQAEDYTITILQNTSPPSSGFISDITFSCNGNVSFTDNSTNIPTSWSWDFGDGTTNNLQSPSHTYGTDGIYTVSLTSTNSFGSNTDTKTNYIEVSLNGEPIAASCTPQTMSTCCLYGILNVSFNTINNSTDDGIEGYQDFTCQQRTEVIEGQGYPISIQTGPNSHDTRVWIDYNNDGDFDELYELVMVSNNTVNASGQIFIQSCVGFYDTPLRMRITSVAKNGYTITPCWDPSYGQTEDYTIIIKDGGIACKTSLYPDEDEEEILEEENELENEEHSEVEEILKEKDTAVPFLCKFYPNPVSGTGWIEYSYNDFQKGHVIIYNMLGEVVGRYTLIPGSNKLAVNTSVYNSGVYSYTIMINDEIMSKERFIVSK